MLEALVWAALRGVLIWRTTQCRVQSCWSSPWQVTWKAHFCSIQTPRGPWSAGHQVVLCYSWDIYLRERRGALDKKTALPSMQVVFVQHQECTWHEWCWDCGGGLCEAENHSWCSHVHSACWEWSWEQPIPNHSQALPHIHLVCSKMEAGVNWNFALWPIRDQDLSSLSSTILFSRAEDPLCWQPREL